MSSSQAATPDAVDLSPTASGISRPRRIAALIDTAQVSGPGRQLAALAQSLADENVELLVVLFQRVGRERPPYAAFLERASVRHVVLLERGPIDFRLVWALRSALEAWQPDIVQTHSYKTSAQMALLRGLGACWPWVAFFHGSTTENLKVRIYHWVDRRLMARADRLVVMSQKHLSEFAALGPRARVIYNAVIPIAEHGTAINISALRLVGPCTATATPDRAPLLGVVGRLSSEKGVDVFLHACAELVRRGRRFSAVVAGDGPERDALAALRDTLALTDRVHFLGTITAVRSLYQQLDLVVIPSRSEGLPNVLLEALNADIPATATHVGAIPEVLTDALAGIVVRPGDALALADGIERALALRDHPAARTARRATVERFSLAHRMHEHIRLYTDLSAAPPP